MSAPVKLNASQLGRLADFLTCLTEARERTGVVADGYQRLDVAIDGQVLQVGWDSELEQYVVDDRVGG